MIDAGDIERLVNRCRTIPPARGNYLESDYVMNLLATVVDYMMHTTAVVRALKYFRDRRWDEIRTIDDLEAVLARYPDDKEGNTLLAQYLWNYNLWTRAHQLRGLSAFLRTIGVTDQPSLRRWATTSDFRQDFEGRVTGLGIAVYQSLVMRQGVETIKPDVHLRRFAETTLGRSLRDTEVVETYTRAAAVLALKAYELDWSIWERQRENS